MSNLLEFLVDFCVNRDSRGPKAYTVAVEGLGRNCNFDPNIDSYPRVQVGRLRKMIAAYYSHHPRSHRLQIPVGHYQVELVECDEKLGMLAEDEGASKQPPSDSAVRAPASVSSLRRIVWALLLVAIGASIGILGFLNFKPEKSHLATPRIEFAVPEVKVGAEDPKIRREVLDFYRDSFRRYANVVTDSDASTVANDARPNYILETSISAADKDLQAVVILSRVEDSTIIWSDRFTVDPQTLAEGTALDKVVAQVAGDFGVIANDRRRVLSDNYAPGYPCLLQYQQFKIQRDYTKAPLITDCLDKMVSKEHDLPGALAALSFVSFAQAQVSGDKVLWNKGSDYAERAYRAGPTNPDAIFAEARSRLFLDDCKAAVPLAEKALSYRRNDPGILGHYAIYLASCMDARSEDMLRKAIALDPNYGVEARATLVFLLFREKRNAEALEIFAGLPPASANDQRTALVEVVALAAMNDLPAARKRWRELAKQMDAPASNTRIVLSKIITCPQIRRQAINMLAEMRVTTT
ncbi:MAG: hypothetical protein ABI668_04440 [Sphingorhabdus sp.]